MKGDDDVKSEGSSIISRCVLGVGSGFQLAPWLFGIHMLSLSVFASVLSTCVPVRLPDGTRTADSGSLARLAARQVRFLRDSPVGWCFRMASRDVWAVLRLGLVLLLPLLLPQRLC